MLDELQRAFAASVVTRSPQPLSNWCNLKPTWRLSVYQQNYHQSLLATLQQIYSYTRQLIGQPCFDNFCQNYIDQHPSTDFDLNHYGEHVPTFLEHYLNTQNLSEPFAHIPDIARLDARLHRVYYAPNTTAYEGPPFEKQPTNVQLQQRFQRLGSIQLLQSFWPLEKLKDSTQSKPGDLPATNWEKRHQPAYFIIYRHEGKPQFSSISQAHYELLTFLAAPHSLKDIHLQKPELTAEFLQDYAIGWVHQLG